MSNSQEKYFWKILCFSCSQIFFLFKLLLTLLSTVKCWDLLIFQAELKVTSARAVLPLTKEASFEKKSAVCWESGQVSQERQLTALSKLLLAKFLKWKQRDLDCGEDFFLFSSFFWFRLITFQVQRNSWETADPGKGKYMYKITLWIQSFPLWYWHFKLLTYTNQ